MIRLLVNVFWTIVAAIIILAGLIVPGMEIPSIVLVLLLFLWRFILYLKRKRPNTNQIPQDVLNDFQTVEKMYEESDGQTEPHQILWKIARRKQKSIIRKGVEYGQDKPNQIFNEDARTRQGSIQSTAETKPRIETGELYPPYFKRTELQSNVVTRITNDKSSFSRPERNNSKGLFGRKRR